MKKSTNISLVSIFIFAVPLFAQVQIWLPDTTASPGDTIMVPVYTENVDPSLMVLAYQMEIHFDETVASITNYDTYGTLTPSTWIATYNFNMPGIVIGGSWYFFPPYLAGAGVLVYLECAVPENAAGSTDLSFSYFLYNEDPMPTTDGSITITTSTTIYVPGDYSTIQEAINAASNGYTILVADGTYSGENNKNLDYLGKSIIVISENGPQDCIIDCEEQGRGFYFHNGEGVNSILTGFKIINGSISGLGGGIHCQTASPTIINCLIGGNYAGDGGGGFYCAASSPIVTNCTIANNTANADDMSAIYIEESSSLTAANCILWGNADGAGFQTTCSHDAGSNIDWNYSCVESDELLTGSGNFTDDPLFADEEDYHLLPGSRAIDAGDPASPYENEPEPNGDRINLGAYGNSSTATQSRVTLAIPRDIYVMAGIPVQVSDGNPDTLFGDDFNYTTPGCPNWRVSRWDVPNATYIRYQEPDFPVNLGLDPPPFTPGLGYWILQDVVDDCVLDIVEGQVEGAVYQGEYLNIAIEEPQSGNRGINQMANPYPYEYDWRTALITDGADTMTILEAAQDSLVNGYAYIWESGSQQYEPISFIFGGDTIYILDAWAGFWLEQLNPDVDLEILFTPRWMEPDTSIFGSDDDEWFLQLPVATVAADYRDEHNRAGIGASSYDGYDFLDAIEFDPYSSSFVQLFFPHPDWLLDAENFTYDYRPSDFPEPKTWEFTVRTNELPNRELILTWPNISEIELSYDFSLEDLDNGVVIDDMRETDDYVFTGGSSSVDEIHFVLTVAFTPATINPKGDNNPQSFRMFPAYPNPFNPETVISFELRDASFVKLVVYNTKGREVACLLDDFKSAGFHNITFDALQFSSGLYFARLTAGKSRLTQKLLLIK